MSDGNPHGEVVASDGGVFHFRLYVAGSAPNSSAAVSNLRSICESRLAGRYRIDTVDVLAEPLRALRDRVLVTPMLVRLAPEPERRIAGTLADAQKVIDTLGISGS